MKDLEGLKLKYENFSDNHPAIATLGETAILFALRHGLEKYGKKVGVPLGHGRNGSGLRQDLIEKYPRLATMAAIAVAPTVEEIMYREILPSILEKYGYDPDSKRTKLGRAAIFAASHAGPHAIPVPQFIGGLNYDRIHQNRGLKYSILAHVTNNTLAVTKFAISKKGE
jgi:hypothetical protein